MRLVRWDHLAHSITSRVTFPQVEVLPILVVLKCSKSTLVDEELQQLFNGTDALRVLVEVFDVADYPRWKEELIVGKQTSEFC